MRIRTAAVLGATLIVAAACGGDGGGAQDEMVAMDTAAQSDAAAGTAGGMQSPPQDADHEFLRMMSDHHEGLVVMAMDAMTRAVDDSVKSAAHQLHTTQAAQQDTMVTMIQRAYGERHQPTIMPKNAAQADSLRQMSGAEADGYFLRTTIAHHEEGIEMIDRFLPRFTRSEVRQMAEKMREGQQREIQELQGKLGRM